MTRKEACHFTMTMPRVYAVVKVTNAGHDDNGIEEMTVSLRVGQKWWHGRPRNIYDITGSNITLAGVMQNSNAHRILPPPVFTSISAPGRQSRRLLAAFDLEFTTWRTEKSVAAGAYVPQQDADCVIRLRCIARTIWAIGESYWCRSFSGAAGYL